MIISIIVDKKGYIMDGIIMLIGGVLILQLSGIRKDYNNFGSKEEEVKKAYQDGYKAGHKDALLSSDTSLNPGVGDE